MESFSCSQLASAIMLELCAEVGSVLIPGQLALCYRSVVTLLHDSHLYAFSCQRLTLKQQQRVIIT